MESREELTAGYPDGPPDDRGMFFEQHSVGKTVALAILVSSMGEAAAAYRPAQGEALRIMSAAYDRFSADASALEDEDLQPEVALARKLLDLMNQVAPQGNLYGM